MINSKICSCFPSPIERITPQHPVSPPGRVTFIFGSHFKPNPSFQYHPLVGSHLFFSLFFSFRFHFRHITSTSSFFIFTFIRTLPPLEAILHLFSSFLSYITSTSSFLSLISFQLLLSFRFIASLFLQCLLSSSSPLEVINLYFLQLPLVLPSPCGPNQLSCRSDQTNTFLTSPNCPRLKAALDRTSLVACFLSISQLPFSLLFN